jgi:hypothetical protein
MNRLLRKKVNEGKNSSLKFADGLLINLKSYNGKNDERANEFLIKNGTMIVPVEKIIEYDEENVKI